MHSKRGIFACSSIFIACYLFYWISNVEGSPVFLDSQSPISSLDVPGRVYFLGFPVDDNNPATPKCGDGSPYSFAFKRGKPEFKNHLVVEFMGGQNMDDRLLLTCSLSNPCNDTSISGNRVPWDNITDTQVNQMLTSCNGIPQEFIRPIVPQIIEIGDESDSMPLFLRSQAEVGKIDISGWNYLYLPYCTKDMFIGKLNKKRNYHLTNIWHTGGYNAEAVMGWIYANFPSLESIIFTGCGEGAAIAPPLYASQVADNYTSKGKPVQNIYAIMDSPMNLFTLGMVRDFRGVLSWDSYLTASKSVGQLNGTLLLDDIENIVKKHEQVRFGIFANKYDESNLNMYREMGGIDNDYIDQYDEWLLQMSEKYSNFLSIFSDGSSHCKYAFSEAYRNQSPPTWKTEFDSFVESMTNGYIPPSPSKSVSPSNEVKRRVNAFRPSPVTSGLIVSAVLLFIYALWFSVMTWRQKRDKQTPTLTLIWVSTLCRYPRIFLLFSLAIPCVFSYLGFKSTGYTIDVDFDFDDFLELDADVALFSSAFDNARKDQDMVVKTSNEKCRAVKTIEARHLNTIKGKGQKVELFYESKHGTNVFTENILREIKALEDSILNFSGYENACWQDDNGTCASFDSPVKAFFDEQGELKNIQDVLFYDILRSGNLNNVDRYFSKTQLASNYTRSTFFLRDGTDDSYLEKMHHELLWPVDQDGKYKHLKFSWSNKVLQKTEAYDALRNDLWWSIGTLSFVTVFIFFKLQNVFLLVMAMAGLVLSFPVAYFWYYLVYDVRKFSLMNFTSLFVMLGIGADDIFLMVDSYRHTKTYLGDTATVEDRMKMAYRKAGSTMLVTSLTASFCFFSNVFSVLKIVKEFGIFMGTTVLINYFHVMTILPAAIVVNDKYIVPLWSKIKNNFQIRCCFPKCLRKSHLQTSCNAEDSRPSTDVEIGPTQNMSANEVQQTKEEKRNETVSIESSTINDEVEVDDHENDSRSNSPVDNETNKMNQLTRNLDKQQRSHGDADETKMSRIDLWFFRTYSPFVFRWRKFLVAIFLLLSLSFGIFGYLKFEQATGNLIVFQEKFNLGRVMRLKYEYFNKNFKYQSEEDERWSTDSSITYPQPISISMPSNYPTYLPSKEPSTSPTKEPVRGCMSIGIPNSKYFEDPNFIQGNIGDEIQVVCKDGYAGSGVMVCQEDSNWSQIVSCTEISERDKCPPLNIPNSNAENIGTDFYVGDVFNLLCNIGYSGENMMTCLSNLTWNPSNFFCEAKSCNSTQVSNSDKASLGSITGTTGENVFVTCNDGFRGSGNAQCLPTGEFTQIICDNSCEFGFANSKNGLVKGITNDTFNIECLEGYNGGGETQCQQDGNFLPTVQCIEEQKCPTKNIENSHSILQGGVGDTVNVTCLDSYEGGGLATCTDSYSWDVTPVCSGKDCDPIYVENSIQVNITGRTGDTVDVTCAEGYSGGGTVICKENGIFDTSQLNFCQPIPDSPNITLISLILDRPMKIVVEGLINENGARVFCQIEGFQESLKEINPLSFPDFEVSFNQTELQSYDIKPNDEISFSCYSEKDIGGVTIKSPTIISRTVEVQVLPREPVSVVVTGTGVPRSKDVLVLVWKAETTIWNPEIERFQCRGKHEADQSSWASKIQSFLNESEATMTLTVEFFSIEYLVQCRFENQFGWSDWVSTYYTLENLDCPKPCLNSGVCNFNTLQCECVKGFTGEQCELSDCPIVGFDECSGNGNCGEHVDGPENGRMCFCYEDFTGIDCSIDTLIYKRKQKAFIVSLTWGLKSSGTSSNLFVLGKTGDNDQAYLTDYIDIADPEVQSWLLITVQKIRANSRLHVNRGILTWIELLQLNSANTGLPFPIPKDVFPFTIKELFEQSLYSRMGNQIGTIGDISFGNFTYVSVDFYVQVPYTSVNSDDAMNDAYGIWNEFLSDINKNAPVGVGKVTLHSDAFYQVYHKKEIVSTTINSWMVSYGISFVIILVFTQNLSLSFWVMVALICMIICLIGLMFSVYSIPFGPIEALGVSVFVGLSSSYVLHAAHAYHDTIATTRQEKIRDAVFAIGSPLSASAISTIGACAFLLGCRIFLFVKLGLLICNNNFIAILYSLIFFIALLAMVGPRLIEGMNSIHEWDFKAMCASTFRNCKLRRNRN